MLKINVRGENIEVTGAIREYVEKKLSVIYATVDNGQIFLNDIGTSS